MPKMKEYAAFAATKDGKMIQVATTEAATEEEAAKILSRFTWATGIDEMIIVDDSDKPGKAFEIKETKNKKETN